MVVDLLDVLAVDWVRIPSVDFAGHYRRVVLVGVLQDETLRAIDWRDARGTTWAIAKVERSPFSTTIYFLPV